MNNRGRNYYRNRGKRKRTSDDRSSGAGGRYKHLTVNHQMNFVDPDSGAYTQNIERTKKYGRRKYFMSPSLPSKKCLSSSMYNQVSSNPNKNHSAAYYNWDLYFHQEVFKKGASTERKIQATERFVARHLDQFPISNLENNKPYDFDIKVSYKDEVFVDEWDNFKEDLTNNPKHTLNCLGIAINQTMIDSITKMEGKDDPNVIVNLPIAIVRISNYGPIISLRDLKVTSYGKLISIRGCVMRVGDIKHSAQMIEFSCMSCKNNTITRQIDGIYTLPTKCGSCNGKKFQPVLNSLSTKTVTSQVIRLQEHFGDEQDDKGRMPRTIDIDLVEHLVCTCMPGDDITVTGIMKARGNKPNKSKKNNTSEVFALYMEANHILNNKSHNKCALALDLTDIDYQAVKEVYRDPNIFKLLVQSLCPGIYGHELIKAGLILSLFGGSTNSSNIRDDIHVLVVGDPGLGKSQMLQACARVAPKGVYVCGTSSTSTGLTVTLIKDPSTGEFILEPGALVLADNGCCCIDEFDKMTTQHQSLLESMEQQSVSVAKSGMVCCLPARTSILAAANPAGGRYTRSKTLLENLNMSQPLLSRFDLIFILLDRPDAHLDSLLSEHVMAVHTGSKSQLKALRFPSSSSSLNESNSRDSTLREKLRLIKNDRIDPIPHRILRNYILYARQYVKPKITLAAADVLQNFYLECRARNDREKITPMTPRQLGALIRLTEARAKLELREEATETDALEVVEIMKYSIADIPDEHIDYATVSKNGKLTANKVKAFMSLLKQQAANGKKNFSKSEMKDLARDEKLVIDDFNALISKLNENGLLLKKGPSLYMFISND